MTDDNYRQFDRKDIKTIISNHYMRFQQFGLSYGEQLILNRFCEGLIKEFGKK